MSDARQLVNLVRYSELEAGDGFPYVHLGFESAEGGTHVLLVVDSFNLDGVVETVELLRAVADALESGSPTAAPKPEEPTAHVPFNPQPRGSGR